MTEREHDELPPERDRLMTRPDESPLPTPLDPAGPRARGYPADPKPGGKDSPGIPEGKNRESGELGRAT